MSDRVTLALPTTNVQTRAFRSHSFNPPPTIASHRSRRTLSLPAREKPMIPPAIAEASESLRIVHDQFSSEQQPCLRGNSDDIGKLTTYIIYMYFQYSPYCMRNGPMMGKGTKNARKGD